jgi:hypothetical protein
MKSKATKARNSNGLSAGGLSTFLMARSDVSLKLSGTLAWLPHERTKNNTAFQRIMIYD